MLRKSLVLACARGSGFFCVVILIEFERLEENGCFYKIVCEKYNVSKWF